MTLDDLIKAVALMAARVGGESEKSSDPNATPGALADADRLPALRLVLGSALLLVGLVCLRPWLCRLAASLQHSSGIPEPLREPSGEAHEPSEQRDIPMDVPRTPLERLAAEMRREQALVYVRGGNA